MELIDILHEVEQVGADLREGHISAGIVRLDAVEQALLDKVYGEPYTHADYWFNAFIEEEEEA